LQIAIWHTFDQEKYAALFFLIYFKMYRNLYLGGMPTRSLGMSYA